MFTNALPISKYDIVFVTAAELPVTLGIHASQVLEPAALMAKCGHRVAWVAAVPLLSFMKDKILFLGRLNSVKNKCLFAGIQFDFVVVPLSIGSPLSYMVRNPFLRWAATRLTSRLRLSKHFRNSRAMVLHARSYYAAHLALDMQPMIKKSACCYVSFDMRSVLADEFPIFYKRFGRFLYGFAKQWEYELLRKSDVSFLSLNYAREIIGAETGVEVHYAPIQGLDRECGWHIDFEKRWETRRVGFAGSIGQWHDPLLLKEMIKGIPGSTAILATTAVPALIEFECKSYPYSDMKKYYDGLLAMVIPGRVNVDDFFVRNKMRNNFFSTKAAEALSRGVPIIVSSELRELSEFVKTYSCGAIYNAQEHKFIFPNADWLEDKEEWRRMTANSKMIGEMFVRDEALDYYVSVWNKLVK